jgi:hypothetical protein
MKKRRIMAAAVSVAVALTGMVVATNAKAHEGHTITIDNVSVTEGNNAVFQLHLSPPAEGSERISVTATTASGSATSSDYTPKSQTFTFEECDGFCLGASLKLFSVPTTEDASPESTETFNVKLSNASATCSIFGFPCPTSVTISDGTAVGTINDDDGADPGPDPTPTPTPPAVQPALSVPTDFTGATTRIPCVFTVVLDRVPSTNVTATWSLSGATSQIGGPTTGQVSFSPGDNLRQITVDVIKQKRRSGTVGLTLSGAHGATIADGFGACTIKKKRRH